MIKLERDLEAYVSREIPKLFKDDILVATNALLPGHIGVDFQFKKKDGTDMFVEVSAQKIGRNKLSQVLNIYAAISNMEPLSKKFELIVIGPKVTTSARKALEKLPVKLLTYKQIGIQYNKFHDIYRQKLQQEQQLSPEEAKLVAKWESENKTTIRASDVKESLHCSVNYAHFLLHNLQRKRWLERISRGLYQFIPLSYGYPERIPPANSFAIASALVEPYYFSYYTSNSHYGFTTQIPSTLFIATTKKKPDFEWTSSTFKFVTLSMRKFFGYTQASIFGAEVNIAEPEKSLVDSFDKPKYAGGPEELSRITWQGWKRIDKEKLVEYAMRMGSHALIQRMGFIIDFLAKENLVEPLTHNLRNTLLSNVGKAVIHIDHLRPKTGKFFKDWRIICNIPKSQLLSEIEIR